MFPVSKQYLPIGLLLCQEGLILRNFGRHGCKSRRLRDEKARSLCRATKEEETTKGPEVVFEGSVFVFWFQASSRTSYLADC